MVVINLSVHHKNESVQPNKITSEGVTHTMIFKSSY
jgi:hypothetical protein